METRILQQVSNIEEILKIIKLLRESNLKFY